MLDPNQAEQRRSLISPTSGEWPILKGRIIERIEKLRDDLEQYGTGDEIRGEIAGLRWLINEVEPPLNLPEDTDTGSRTDY